jgi:hypothetical protein
MPLLHHLKRHHQVDLSDFVPVFVAHNQIGWTKRSFAQTLNDKTKLWQIDHDRLSFTLLDADFATRSKAVHESFLALSAAGILPPLPDYSAFGGDDWLSVGKDDAGNHLFQVHRFYSPRLGIVRHCVFIHGYEGDKYWAAVRSQHVESGAGEYDMIAAGTVTIEQTIAEALLDEGHSECGLTEALIPFVKPVGKLNLLYHLADGFLMNEIFYIHDFDTTNRFKPSVVNEMEIERFDLLSIAEVKDLLENTHRFKAQINAVMVDFLVRHGHITHTHPEYREILGQLHNYYEF